MISKNVDFFKNPSSLGLQVSQTDFGARISYGTIIDSFYNETFKTNSIKKIKGEAGEDSFLDPIKLDKNIVPFSFKNESFLVLTCSLAFQGSQSKKGENITPSVAYFFEGISDCFFQEKKKEDILNPYISNSQELIYLKDKEVPFPPDLERPNCPPDIPTCPIYYYDMDVPIYNNGIQFIEGSLSFYPRHYAESLKEHDILTEESSLCSNCPPFYKKDLIKYVTYIKVEGERVVN